MDSYLVEDLINSTKMMGKSQKIKLDHLCKQAEND